MVSPPWTVLLVEDDPSHAMLLERAFGNRPGEFRLKRAHSLAAARAQLAIDALPQLILADMRLPDGDGLALIATERSGRCVPVVIMTSYGNEEFAVEAMKAGAIDYVVKSETIFSEVPHIVERSIREWEHMNEAQRAETALRENEERLRSLFENSPLGLYRTTPEGVFLFANPAMVRLIGFDTFEELSGHNLVQEEVDPNYPRERFQELIERDGQVRGLETSWMRRDGKQIFVREYAQIVRGEDGHVLYYEGTAEDVTERKLAELEAQRQSRNLGYINELAIALAESSTETDVYQLIAQKINHAVGAVATVITTYQPEENYLVLKGAAISPVNEAMIRQALSREVIGLKIPVSPQVREQLLAGQMEILHSLGELSADPISQDLADSIRQQLNLGNMTAVVVQFEGELIGLVAVYQAKDSPPVALDMLQAMGHVVAVALRRRRAEDDLRLSEERFRSLVQNAYDIITVVDQDAIIRYDSPSASRVIGYKEGSLVGRNCFDLVHPDDLGGLLELYRRAIQEGLDSASFEYRFRHANGSWVYLEGAANNLLNHPQIRGIVITSRDISERRRTADLLATTNRELAQAYDATLEGWSRALELREQETANHGKRVVDLTLALARKLGFREEDCEHIRRGALLHDIGKMGIPDSILMKPATLNSEDWVQMRRHPDYAYRLLSGIPYLAPSIDIPYCHHERWNGSGYPRGLKGTDIPRAARLFMVVDVWDALSHTRPYRPAWSEEEARAHLRENAGVLFDPQVVEAFLEMVGK